MQTQEALNGLIERVTFHNENNGFCVLRVKVKGHRDLVTVTGMCAAVTPGEWIQAGGFWHQDRQHGQQFKSLTLKLTPPTTLEGIEKYLASGLIKGLGPVYAHKLVKAFGEDVFTIIEADPGKLLSIPGIGPLRAGKISSGWAAQRAIRDIMLFLHSHGISTTRATRIYKTYGDQAIEIIRENPYRLAQDIRGIGFLGADKIAESLGIEKSSLIRARAGISYVLLTATEAGHCGLPIAKLLSDGQELLDIEVSILQEALTLELGQRSVIKDTTKDCECIFLAGLYAAEKGIAERLQALTQGTLPWPAVHLDEAILWVEKQNGITLSLSQKEALSQALSSKVTIITGGPGVGKTTLLRSILQIVQAKSLKLALCAPTGRAAKRMSEATGIEAKTIHRLLEISPQTGGFARNETSPLSCDLVVVDEVSMVDVRLMHALLKAIPSQAALLLVGDPDQLPSVGPGHVLGDLISSSSLPCIHLTEVFRQAANSQIISVAHTLNKGFIPQLHGYGPMSDFFFLEAQEPEQALKTILELVTKRLPTKLGLSPLHDIQVLCPMTRGFVGTRTLNAELQKALNPPNERSIQKFGWFYSPGDKVIQVTNNYNKGVYNGDIGLIHSIDKEEGDVIITFDGREVPYEVNELDEIALAYALTIHKSQGSEYPAIIIPVLTTHYPMLHKNLLYTGITRGKKLVILVGQKKAIAIAARNKEAQKRWSMLEERLRKSSQRKSNRLAI